jgi:hypothetical protein
VMGACDMAHKCGRTLRKSRARDLRFLYLQSIAVLAFMSHQKQEGSWI